MSTEPPDSPPPVYSSLRGIFPPAYTKGDCFAHHALHASHLSRDSSQSRVRTVANNDDEKKTTGIEDMPTEILHSIICLACSLSGKDPDLLELRVSQETIFSCAGVCRKWMAVAASHPELWSRVLDFARHGLPTLYRLLRISNPLLLNVGHRSAPLTLSWPDESLCDIYGIIQLIYQSRKRIHELHVEVGFHGSSFLLDYLCNMEASHLEALTWHTRLPANIDTPVHQRAFLLPKLYFKRLDFRRVAIALQPTPCLRSLTALSIYHSRSMTLMEWVDVLWSAPHLRFLSIHSSIRSDGLIPAIPSDSILLVDLALLTIGSRTSAEIELHLFLLGAIDIPPRCGLQIASLPYVQNGQCRVIISSKIFKMMARCHEPTMPLELFADEQFQFTMGNVRDPQRYLDWARLGEQRVLAHLRSFQTPLVTTTSCSSNISEACDIFPQVVSYFGNATYSKVTSLCIFLLPFDNCRLEDWEDHPYFVEIFRVLFHLLAQTGRVKSLSLNEEGTFAFIGALFGKAATVVRAKHAVPREIWEGLVFAGFVSLLPLIRHFTIHASKTYASWTIGRPINPSARRKPKPPLSTATHPSPSIEGSYDSDPDIPCSYDSSGGHVGDCRIASNPSSPLPPSAYFERFCERT